MIFKIIMALWAVFGTTIVVCFAIRDAKKIRSTISTFCSGGKYIAYRENGEVLCGVSKAGKVCIYYPVQFDSLSKIKTWIEDGADLNSIRKDEGNIYITWTTKTMKRIR